LRINVLAEGAGATKRDFPPDIHPNVSASFACRFLNPCDLQFEKREQAGGCHYCGYSSGFDPPAVSCGFVVLTQMTDTVVVSLFNIGDSGMTASLLMRTAVILLLIGLCAGIAMGMTQNFGLAPAHAHLNLVGFVLPFVSGLYYRSVPAAESSRLARPQAWLAIIGGVLLPAGIGAELAIGPQYESVIIIGSLCVLAAMALFAVIVFRTSGLRTA